MPATAAPPATTPPSLRERISSELTTAMKEREEVRLATLRLIQCAVRDRDIAARASDKTTGCDETEILAILSKMVKQREESSRTYEEAGRPELAERERDEIKVIREFMPVQLDPEALAQAAREVVDELGASGLKDMGKCMDALKARYAGRIAMPAAAAEIKRLLS